MSALDAATRTYHEWRGCDMGNDKERMARAIAYTESADAWACGQDVRTFPRSTDRVVVMRCRRERSHEGECDPIAWFPWQRDLQPR